VTVGLSAAAYALANGSYFDTIAFTNDSDGSVQTRTFDLEISPLVLNGSFQSGTFTNWTLSGGATASGGEPNCLIVHNNTNYVHSGTYGAALGPASLGYMSQTLPTAAGQLYMLSLWVDYYGWPNQFLVEWGGDTIYSLYSATDQGNVGWTNLQFLVQSTTAGTVLEFGFDDGSSFLGLDDINVTAVPAPSFQGAVRSGGSFRLTWGTAVGAVYQMQYTTNIDPGNWVDLGNPITAASSSETVTDTIGTNHQRFYRVLLLP
jgi:hypothetical protein